MSKTPSASKDRTSPEEDAVIEVRDLSVIYDMDRGQSRVLDGVSIPIRRNEIIGVVGESGSGKSMFASAMMDAVPEPGQITGEITYYPENGDPVDVLDLDDRSLKKYRWEDVSMVFQGAMSSFNPTLTVRGHFEETIKAHDMNVDTQMAHAWDLLRDLHLDPQRVMDSYPHELSGGMRQRALIALSLVLEPEVLIMDEPTAALDLLMQRSIINLLRELQESYDLTIVFITHDLPLVVGLCDRIAVLYAFEFIEVGLADQVLRSAAHPYTRSLLRAVPNIEMAIEDMETIEGDSPDPVNVPTGCSFHPRCPLADDQCVAEDPELIHVEDDHAAACYYTEEAATAIPYQLGNSGNDTTGGEFDE